ncbi:Gfo/Idh/MocA family oxidoreductase [Prolixibacteraceae bacterium Z1-6]|uniref:Gfo/Idh/MocA family oxidoreductase n=1 Tax=Draconibacterium aestuarii TaxID=2998507 RepID=A0A9X3F2L6_9BACT|nr:Gfo/Idh/MocA family oxidoreductase [Prolixibacteraceae bacterium Z1-6]
MKTRRQFINTMGKGVAASTFALSSAGAFAGQLVSTEKKNIVIGIIGAENSHATAFGKMFNVKKQFPGVEVRYIWGETDEFAKKTMKNGQIPNQVKDPKDMLGKIDALIVDHRHPKYHLEAAVPFIKAGIPTFIDKPFCYRLEEGKKFLRLAREYGTPVTSYSSIAHTAETEDIKKQIAEMGEIKNVVRYGPGEFESKYGNVFFYGVHTVQPLMYMFGDDINKVKVTRNGIKGSAALVFKNGLFATIVFNQDHYGWQTFAETKNGITELKSRITEEEPKKNNVDMVEMFRTGKEPRSYESILKCVAVLEALEKSYVSEDWVKVENVSL